MLGALHHPSYLYHQMTHLVAPKNLRPSQEVVYRRGTKPEVTIDTNFLHRGSVYPRPYLDPNTLKVRTVELFGRFGHISSVYQLHSGIFPLLLASQVSYETYKKLSITALAAFHGSPCFLQVSEDSSGFTAPSGKP